MTVTGERVRTPGGIGHSAARPDGVPKVAGTFAFSSDLFADGMVWGHVLRSPHPHARIRSVDIGPALAMAGVHAVLTADDVPGENAFGLEHADQPVFARDVVRFTGEAVAAIAADHPDTARRAAAAIVVDYEPARPARRPRGGHRRTADPPRRERLQALGDPAR
jgi:xanthine dehydrogenase molybdopterin-binding subunit B